MKTGDIAIPRANVVSMPLYYDSVLLLFAIVIISMVLGVSTKNTPAEYYENANIHASILIVPQKYYPNQYPKYWDLSIQLNPNLGFPQYPCLYTGILHPLFRVQYSGQRPSRLCHNKTLKTTPSVRGVV